MRVITAAAAAVGVMLLAAPALAAHDNGPPWRDNGRGPWITRVCALPIPAVAGCSADVVTDSSGRPLASSSPPPGAYGPTQFHSAYNLPTTAPNAQTIGIVDAYDDPNIASDLATFDSYYGLPAPPSFRKVNQTGGTSYPAANSGWSLEIALDVEVAHAMCQSCNILLVEASSNSFADLGTAENEAVSLGATVVSNSWGGSEFSSETSYDTSYFHHPGIPITVSAGDSGYGVEYPAASQYVTAVGGTTLTLNGGSWAGETVWSGTGSGCSSYETKPSWQTDTGCSRRTVVDVSADADPNTGAAVYDSVAYSGQTGWFQVGGTSLASPLIAAVYALAGNPSGVVYGSAPYAASASQLHDVTSGSNGSCGSYLCTGASGYDGPTGVGTPNGDGAFLPQSPTTPGAPTGLTATAGNGSVALSWTAPTNTGGGITGYKIYRSNSSGAETLYQSVGVTSYTDTSVTNGTTYYYEVTAVSNGGESSKSLEAKATPQAPAPPGAPTTLTATAGNGSVALSWTAPTNPGSGISGYNIYRSTTSGEETLVHQGVGGTTYTDAGLTNGTTYYYEVTAAGNGGESGKSNEASATPKAPAGDFAVSISPSSRFLGSTGSVTYTITITRSGGFSGAVMLTVGGLPPGVTGSFSPNPVTTTSSTLTVTASHAGFSRVTITVTGTSGAIAHSATTSLTVL